MARYLVGRVLMDLDDAVLGADGQLVGSSTEGLLDALDLDWEEHGWTGGSLTKLTALAGLRDVVREAQRVYEPGKTPDTRTIRATAFFLADAEVTHVFSFGSDEPPSESTSRHSGLVARTRLVLTVRGSEIVGVRPDSDTTVFTPSRYHDNGDSMEEVNEALASIPGLAAPEGRGRDGEQQITIHGTDQVADLHWGIGDYGGLVVRIGTDEAQVTCEYDDTTWVGGRDGDYMEPPYYLAADTPNDTATGAWALSAWMIHRLIEGET